MRLQDNPKLAVFVSVAGGVSSPPLEGLVVERPGDGEDAVEVVAFVLEEFGQVVLELPGLFLPLEVAKAEFASPVSPEPDQQVGRAHAVVPKFHHFLAQAGQFRIDHGHRAIDVEDYEPFHDTQLRGRNGSAGAVPGPEFEDDIGHGVHDVRQFGQFVFHDRRAGLVEAGISEEEDIVEVKISFHGVRQIFDFNIKKARMLKQRGVIWRSLKKNLILESGYASGM